ncbi:MAG: hypothetical protein RBR43_03930 [Desulfuromonadaceae bacterium]|nr:hypothetical protein [Desulfuromonas sp.]MDY0185018.1 hypothetical protein [Desulfuromonadaceae bacterium]
MKPDLSDQLSELYALVVRERECARELRIDELEEVVRDKAALMQQLQGFDDDVSLTEEQKELANKIRFENRCNAYLLWSALNWIRESMAFFGRKSAPDTYNPSGTTVNGASGGHLLSGRI